jgi:hypothetical protein
MDADEDSVDDDMVDDGFSEDGVVNKSNGLVEHSV